MPTQYIRHVLPSKRHYYYLPAAPQLHRNSPSESTRRAPIIFALHGWGQHVDAGGRLEIGPFNYLNFRKMSQLHRLAEAGRASIVFAQAGGWFRNWDVTTDPRGDKNEDFTYIADIIKHLAKHHYSNHLPLAYVWGFSLGSAFAHYVFEGMPRSIDGAVFHSGFSPSFAFSNPAASMYLPQAVAHFAAGRRVVVVQGGMDPFYLLHKRFTGRDMFVEIGDQYENAGYDVWRMYDEGLTHTWKADVNDRLLDWMEGKEGSGPGDITAKGAESKKVA